MATSTVKIDRILAQIKELDYMDRINLLEKAVSLIKLERLSEKQIKLTSLNGLGAEIWKDLDLDKYVENEREWE